MVYLGKITTGVPGFSLFCLLPGRPKNVKEQDVYICDYRLDKSAHLFYKIHRNRYPVCTKQYAFNHFPKRLTPKRDFSVRMLSGPVRAGLLRSVPDLETRQIVFFEVGEGFRVGPGQTNEPPPPFPGCIAPSSLSSNRFVSPASLRS